LEQKAKAWRRITRPTLRAEGQGALVHAQPRVQEAERWEPRGDRGGAGVVTAIGAGGL